MLLQTKEKTNLPHFITNICVALSRGVLAIEDIVFREDQVIVRYETKHDRNIKDVRLINNSRVVTVNSFDALCLYDGKILEHRDTVYQIKTS